MPQSYYNKKVSRLNGKEGIKVVYKDDNLNIVVTGWKLSQDNKFIKLKSNMDGVIYTISMNHIVVIKEGITLLDNHR